jgi:hypothetical protein
MASMIIKGSAPATLPEYNLFKLPDTQTAAVRRKIVIVYPVAPPSMNSVPQFHVPGAGKDYIDTERSTMHLKLKFVKVRKGVKRRSTAPQTSRRKRAVTPPKQESGSESESSESETDPPTTEGGAANTSPPADVVLEEEIEDGGSPSDLIFPINCIHQTAWRQIDVEVNNVNLIKANNLNPYEVMFKTLLRYGSDAKATHLTGMGYYTEEAGMLDEIGMDGRLSVIKRWWLYSHAKVVDLEGPLMLDALQLNGRPLINGVNLTLKFYPQNKAFFTMCKMDEDEYTVEIVDIYLKICKIEVSDAIILAHSEALKESNAVYPFTRCETKAFTYSKGLSNITIDDLFHGRVPSRVVFGMVSADAFNGNVRKNPFNFKHYNVSDIALTIDGNSVPGKALQLGGWPDGGGPDSDTNEGRQYIDAYLNLSEVSGTMGQNAGNAITIEQFAQGYSLFAFNLDPQLKPGNYMNLVAQGNVRLEIRFKKPLPETMVAVIYSERTSAFEIDVARNVIAKDT